MNERDGQRDEESLRTAQAWALGFLAGAVILAAMGLAYLIGFNRGEDQEPGPGQAEVATETASAETPDEGPGLELFAANCGSCHALSAAGTSGTSGPDLDGLAPDEQRVLDAIENGGTGAGVMPAGLLEGEEAQQVAEFVAASAGQ